MHYVCPSCGCVATRDATSCDGCGKPTKQREGLASLKTVAVSGGILFLLALSAAWLLGKLSDTRAEVAPISSEISDASQTPTGESRSATSEPAPTDLGKWLGHAMVSQTGDSTGYIASLEAENTITSFLATSLRPTLVIRCEQGEVSLHIVTGIPAQVEWGGGNTVRYSFDETTVVTEKWSPSQDRTALGLWSTVRSIELAHRIAQSQQLVFEFTPFRGSVAKIIFKTRGLAAHLDKIIQDTKHDGPGK